MPTMGAVRGVLAVEPRKSASPKAKMPPSDATIQYPRADGVSAMPTMGRLRWMAPVEP